MDTDRRLPASLRQQLQRALRLVEDLRGPQQADDEIQLQRLEELKSCVSDALTEVRGSQLPQKQELARPLKIADGILQYLDDPEQRDARSRLRDVATQLRETLR